MRESGLRFITMINTRLAETNLPNHAKEEIQKQSRSWAEYFDDRFHNAAAVGSRYLLGEKFNDRELLEMTAPIIVEMGMTLQDFASRIIHLYILLLEHGCNSTELENFMESMPRIQEASRNGVQAFKQKRS